MYKKMNCIYLHQGRFQNQMGGAKLTKRTQKI